MNVVALITWFSAVAGGLLLLLAARLVAYTGDFQGAAVTRLCVSDLRPGPRRRARGGSVWRGGMT